MGPVPQAQPIGGSRSIKLKPSGLEVRKTGEGIPSQAPPWNRTPWKCQLPGTVTSKALMLLKEGSGIDSTRVPPPDTPPAVFPKLAAAAVPADSLQPRSAISVNVIAYLPFKVILRSPVFGIHFASLCETIFT
jgi:hypothetical protein